MEGLQAPSLQSKIIDELCKRRILQAEIALIKEKRDSFIQDYMAELKPLYDDLDRVKSLIDKHASPSVLPSAFNVKRADSSIAMHEAASRVPDTCEENDNTLRASEKFFEDEGYFLQDQMNQEDAAVAEKNEITRIYRKLVKRCHPDIGDNDPDQKEIFDMVQTAYDNQDMKMLIMVEHALSEDVSIPDKEGDGGAEDFLRNLEHENYVFKTQKQELMNSPSFALERQIRWAEMCGLQPMSRIKEDLLNEVNAVEEVLRGIGVSVHDLEANAV